MKKMSLALSIGVLGVLFLFSGCEESVSSENVTPSQAVLENGTECQVVKDSSSNYKVICSSDTLDALFNSQNKSEMASDFECSSTKISDEKTGKTGVQVLCKGLDTLVVWNGLDGKNGGKGDKGDAGESCNVEPLAKDAGYKIVCGGDSVGVVLNGKNGEDGKDAPAGSVTDVAGCTATRYTDETTKKTGVSLKCGDASPVIIWDGEKGEAGVGKDGASCTTTSVTKDGKSGVKISCPNSDEVTIWDGENGKDASAGSVTEVAGCTATRYTDETTKKTGVSLKCGDASPVIIWDGENGKDGEDGKDASVENLSGASGCEATRYVDETTKKTGVSLKCGDSSPVIIWDGENGKDGKDGDDGKDGASCTTTSVTKDGKSGVKISCPNSDEVTIWNGEDGKKGEDGASCTTTSVTKDGKSGVKISCPGENPLTVWDGKDGDDGKDGSSCTVASVSDNGKSGVKVTCPGADPVIVWNGENGKDGKDGESCSIESVFENGKNGVKITCSGESLTVFDGTNGGSSSTETENLEARCEVIRNTKTDFVPVEDVLPCVKDDEKAVIIIRHAERDSNNSSNTGPLNLWGYGEATALGYKMRSVREKYNLQGDFYYMYTSVPRAQQTARLIAAGMGEHFIGGVNHEQSAAIDGSYFANKIGGTNDWEAKLSEYAYKYDQRYTYSNWGRNETASLSAKDEVDKLIRENFTYDKLKTKYTLGGTHDTFVLPMMIVLTEKQIGMDYYNHRGDYHYVPNFMSGVAFFVNENGVTASVAVKGLSSGRAK